MTAARLSPAANLLRNSKLFALPPSVALPPSRPTAEPVANSDTATTIYPTRAALQTPPSSLKAGDWGLKRNLPLKSTTNTSTPTIRLRKDFDSEYHITDFESAADHVVTLNKWSNVNPQVTSTPRWGATRSADRRTFSVFHPDVDNATSPSSSHILNFNSVGAAQRTPEHLQTALQQLRADQKAEAEAKGTPLPAPRAELHPPPKKAKRWRYDGPWLAGMSNLEFDNFIRDLTFQHRLGQFDDFLLLRDQDARDAAEAAKMAAAAEEKYPEATEELGSPATEVRATRLRQESESANAREKLQTAQVFHRPLGRQELIPRGMGADLANEQRLRGIKKELRSNPEEFAIVIADFLDLPDGPSPPATMYGTTQGGGWKYARELGATPHYKEIGPPRTHPSAGLSYVRSTQFARNDAKIGPASPTTVLPARLLKDANQADGNIDRRSQSIGVGGFVARPDNYGTKSVMGADQWKPVPGGPKMVVKLLETTVQHDGGIEAGVVRDKDYELDEDNVPYNRQDWEHELRARRTMPQAPDRLQQLDQPAGTPRQYRKAEPLPAGLDEDASDIMAAMTESFKRGER